METRPLLSQSSQIWKGERPKAQIRITLLQGPREGIRAGDTVQASLELKNESHEQHAAVPDTGDKTLPVPRAACVNGTEARHQPRKGAHQVAGVWARRSSPGPLSALGGVTKPPDITPCS